MPLPIPQMPLSPYAYNPVPVPRRVPRLALLVLLVALPICVIGGTLLLAIAEAIIKALLHVG